MEETVKCPGCQAQLAMPVLPAGQTVQCARCRRVFEPRHAASSPTTAQAASRRQADADAVDEHELFLPPRRLIPVESLVGPWFGYLTILVLAAGILAFVARAYAEYQIIDEFAGGPRLGPNLRRNAFHAFRLIEQVEFFQVITSWVVIPCFAIWLYLASRNARLLHASGFSLSPGWVVALFFCPVLNVIFVYLNLQEIWRASDPRKIETAESWRNASPGLLIRLWGLTVLFATLLLFCAGRDGGLFGRWTICTINLGIAIAAGLLIAIIYLIQARQQERYIRLHEDPD